jgi:hypothetical protein
MANQRCSVDAAYQLQSQLAAAPAPARGPQPQAWRGVTSRARSHGPHAHTALAPVVVAGQGLAGCAVGGRVTHARFALAPYHVDTSSLPSSQLPTTGQASRLHPRPEPSLVLSHLTTIGTTTATTREARHGTARPSSSLPPPPSAPHVRLGPANGVAGAAAPADQLRAVPDAPRGRPAEPAGRRLRRGGHPRRAPMRAHLRRGAGLRGPVRALPRRARRRQEGAQEEGAQGAAEPRVRGRRGGPGRGRGGGGPGGVRHLPLGVRATGGGPRAAAVRPRLPRRLHRHLARRPLLLSLVPPRPRRRRRRQ